MAKAAWSVVRCRKWVVLSWTVNILAAAANGGEIMEASLEDTWARETQLAQTEVEQVLLRALGQSLPPAITPISTPPFAAPPKPMPTATTAGPTASPPTNCLNGRTEEQFLLDELTSITPAVDRLFDPSKPQGMALNFLLNDTLFRQDVCAYPTTAQRYGLGTCERCIATTI
jgi:hypothetical protein